MASTSRPTPRRRVAWASISGSIAALSLLLAACGGSSTTGPGASSGTPTSTVTCPSASVTQSWHLVSSGTLTVASDTTYAPAEYPDPNNATHFIGYDMDLIREVARRMCLQANILKAGFDAIIPDISSGAVGQGRYDLSISSFTINDKRLEKVNMIPYLTAGESILVPKGNPQNIQKFDDMCGKTIAVQNGTVEKDELNDANGTGPGTSGQPPVCKTAGKLITLVGNDDQGIVVQQVLNGRADATYQDEPVTIYYVVLHPDKLQNGPRTVAPAPQGIVVRKDNPDLESAITAALCGMEKDGTYARILATWQASGEAFQTPNCPA